MLIFTEYKKVESNKIVPYETFSQNQTALSTNSVEAFKVTLFMLIVLTYDRA